MTCDATLDTSGLFCPLPIIRTAERLREIAPGAILEVVATDFGILEDMPAWCRLTGHKLIHADHPQYLIERRSEP